MKTGADGLKLIKEFEGCKLEAYVCPAGILTIGYGHTGVDVTKGLKISQERADQLLVSDLTRFEDVVNASVTVPITQSMFDALVSFSFNCGVQAFKESTLLRLLNTKDYNGAAAQFDRWVKGPNGPLPGLVRRRDAEEALFRKDGLNPGGEKTESAKTVKIKAIQDTVLKKSPVGSAELREDEKVTVKKGKEYQIVWQGKEESNHIKVSLAGGAGNWFIYAPHWEGIGQIAPSLNPAPTVSSGKVLLPTPYFSQRDNATSGNDNWTRTCFSSCCAMLAVTVKPGCVSGDDAYIKKRQPYGDTTDANAQVRCLQSLGINARFITNGNNALVKKQIDRGIPVPCGILHKGPSSAPSGGGHWICVVGYDSTGFIVNDPWGEIDNASGTYISTNGKHLHYSYRLFDVRWTVSGSSDGWCVVVD